MKKPSTFLRVINSYSKFEKFLSLALIAIFIAASGFMVYESRSSDPSAKNDLIYTEGFQTNIFRINPVYADLNEADKDITKLVFRGLTKYDPETQKIVGDIADINISEDKLTYTFTLKDNIYWHDGELLDSEDVYFTFHDIIQNENFDNLILKANFEGIEINIVDDTQIEFKLSAPNSFFITNTTIGILPKHILENVPIYDLLVHDFNYNPVGNGPYKISSPLSTTMSGVSQVVLEQFDDFYETQSEIKKIRFYGYPNKTEFLNGISTLNAIPKITEDVISQVTENGRFSLYGYSLPQYNAVFINMENPTLKSTKVRQALQKAIYKDAFLEVMKDTIPVETPVLSLDQEDYKYTASIDEAKKLLDNAGFKEESAPTETEEITTAEESSEEESSEDPTDEETIESPVVVEETTEETASGPIIRKNAGGEILEFTLISRLYPEGSYRNGETETVINYLQEKWNEAGIKINVELYDKEILNQKIRNRDYDLLLYGQSLGYNLDLYSYWHSTQATEEGLNLSNYKSFAVDTLIEGIRNTFDEEEKEEKLRTLANTIQEDIPAIFLYRTVYYYASDGKVKGINLDNLAFPADRFCKLNEWYF